LEALKAFRAMTREYTKAMAFKVSNLE